MRRPNEPVHFFIPDWPRSMCHPSGEGCKFILGSGTNGPFGQLSNEHIFPILFLRHHYRTRYAKRLQYLARPCQVSKDNKTDQKGKSCMEEFINVTHSSMRRSISCHARIESTCHRVGKKTSAPSSSIASSTWLIYSSFNAGVRGGTDDGRLWSFKALRMRSLHLSMITSGRNIGTRKSPVWPTTSCSRLPNEIRCRREGLHLYT